MTRELSTDHLLLLLLIIICTFAAGFLAGAFYTQERQAERVEVIVDENYTRSLTPRFYVYSTAACRPDAP